MSFKRKNTRPTKVSDILVHYEGSEGLPWQPDNICETSNNQPNFSPEHQFPSSFPLNNGNAFSSCVLDTAAAKERSPWQVSIALPNDPLSLPTMVTATHSTGSKWTVTSSCNVADEQLHVLRRHPVMSESSQLVDTAWSMSPDNRFGLTNPSPLTNGQHNDPLISDSSNVRPPLKKSRKIRYKYQANSQVNVKYKCDICLYCTNRSDHYKRHLMTHSEEKPLKCLTCGYGTGRSDHFRRHLMRHGLCNEEILRQCELNGIRKISHTSSRAHNVMPGKDDEMSTCVSRDIHSNSTGDGATSSCDKKFSCKLCGYSTDRSSHYTRHMRTHSDDKPFHCEACGKQFKLDTYLKKHRCSVKSPPSPSISTSLEQLMSSSPVSKPGDDFTRFVSESGSPPMCTVCGMLFQSLPDLATHICPHLLGNL